MSINEPCLEDRFATIRAAAEKQKKLQLLAADGSLKGTTVAYEMAKLSDVILRELDRMAGARTIFCRCSNCGDERGYVDKKDGIFCAACGCGPLIPLRIMTKEEDAHEQGTAEDISKEAEARS